jgi:hypothetical protein
MADAENIDGTTGETGPYNTKIPALAENANIQEALRIYHYGTKTPPADVSTVISNSVAGHFKNMSTRVTNLETTGIGSVYSSSEPTPVSLSQTAIPDGFIWADVASSANIVANTSTALYQDDAPVSGESTPLVDGTLWVDKNSSPLTMYVYDAEDEEWKEIGA